MSFDVDIIRVLMGDEENGYIPIIITTSRGEIFCRYYKSSTTTSGAIWVGGVGGGFDSPAGGLYPQLSRKLKEEGISS
ncbi:MAG: hypothetical protein ACXVHS_11470, partial [Methanobacterium sp.]